MKNTRRRFIQSSAAAGAGLFLSPLEPFSMKSKPSLNMNYNFELLIMATNWGFGGTVDEFCAKAKKEGYDGIEVWLPGDDKSRQALSAAAKNNGLKLGILYGGGNSNPQKNLEEFSEGMKAAVQLQPIYINCHSGKDYFTFDQNKKMIDLTTELSKQSGIPFYHETHRGRSLYSGPVTRNFIEKIPELRITADLSHWCAVHESLLGDQPETLELTLSRTEHIHARIGHAEGPQVNDPRAPEWKSALEAHFKWWDVIVQRKKSKGEKLTILTEFGPADYMWTLPYTRQPLSNQWEINVHMMKALRERYK